MRPYKFKGELLETYCIKILQQLIKERVLNIFCLILISDLAPKAYEYNY